jgi:SAM-dependent methyltransferase
MSNINNTFFKGVYKDVWRELIPAGLTEAEAEFIIDEAGLQADYSVADIFCGYGRHTLSLARKGVRVTAIDNSPEYIKEIQSISKEENLPVQPNSTDIISASLGEGHQAVICMGNSFSFFNRQDTEQLLKSIGKALAHQGKLIINSWMIAEIAIRHFKEKEWYEAGPFKCILDYTFLFNPDRIESEQTIIAPDGSIERIEGIDYIYSLDDLKVMLQAAGLKITGLFSTPRKRKFVLGDPRIYIVAEKII